MSQHEKKLLFFLAFLVFLALGFFRVSILNQKIFAETIKKIEEQNKLERIYQDTFGKLELEARSALVYSVDHDQILFAKNENEARPIASITKVMTALIALETLGRAAQVVIYPSDIALSSDYGLLTFESWPLSTLASLMLLSSSNDAAQAIALASSRNQNQNEGIARASFMEQMNERAWQLGLSETFFKNETGLDIIDSNGIATSASNFSSAIDVAQLFAYFLHNWPTILEPTVYPEFEFISLDNQKHLVKNTNSIVSEIPGLLASKTGLTDLAGGNLVMAFKGPSKQLIITVVLGGTSLGRFEDSLKLVKMTTEYLQQINL